MCINKWCIILIYVFVSDLYEEHDLIRAIDIPFNDPKTQFFEEGADGFPAFGFKPGSDVKSPYRLLLPEKFYPEFSILVMVKPGSRAGGFIFSVVNPLETVVQLGIQLQPSGHDTNISLLYTDASIHFSSQYIARYVSLYFYNQWLISTKGTLAEICHVSLKHLLPYFVYIFFCFTFTRKYSCIS